CRVGSRAANRKAGVEKSVADRIRLRIVSGDVCVSDFVSVDRGNRSVLGIALRSHHAESVSCNAVFDISWFGCSDTTLASYCRSGSLVVADLVCPRGDRLSDLGTRKRLHSRGFVLQQNRGGDIWRRVCRAGFSGPRSRANLSLGLARRDAGWL